MVPTKNTDFIVARGRKNGPFDMLSLGALPVRDSVSIRAANTITRPNHVIWSFKTGEEAKLWFKDNYPRIDFDQLVSDDEWDRYAKAKGTTFPPCQYCPSLQASPANGECGIVLLGDAAHSFSPDTGQGINSGLSDVVQLKEILEQSGNVSLGAALKEYERVRAPEVRSKSFSSFFLNLAENTKHIFALHYLPL
jgi:kynurenine 3-monooxygenase